MLAEESGSLGTPNVRAAMIATSQSNYTQAKKLLLEAQRLDPNTPGLDYQLAIVAFSEMHIEEAKANLQKSLARKDSVADSQNLLGAILLREGEYPEAISHLQAAIDADAKLTEAYSNLAAAYRLNFEPLKAIDALNKAAALDEKQRSLYELQIRFALIEAGQTTEIEKTLATKLADSEVESDWLITAAALDLRRGRIDRAALFLEKAGGNMNSNLFKVILNDRAIKTYSADPRILQIYRKDGSSSS